MKGTFRSKETQDIIEKIVSINRVTKVTKGGKKMSFSALVVVGDAKGRVGMDLGKANDVAGAIKKGIAKAKNSMIPIALSGSTIAYETMGIFGAARVLLKPGSPGTGVIAAGPVRAVCECVGISDILTKCLTTNNPLNVIKATIEGLRSIRLEGRNKAFKSDKKVSEEELKD